MRNIILVTARLKSTRLPRKVLKPLVGRPMLCHLLDRMKQVTEADTVVICTSHLMLDDPLEALAEKEGVGCFRGDPIDVLVRLRNCARKWGAHTIYSCTGDNPLTDTEWANRLLKRHTMNDASFTRLEGLPIGTYGSAMTLDAVEEACRIKAEKDTEIWGSLFTSSERFKSEVITTNEFANIASARLTVDTPEDFKLIEHIFSQLYSQNRLFGLRDVQRFLCDNQALMKINAHIKQVTRPDIACKNSFPESSK